MATIIDSLVIELGLDTTKFDEGQKKMVANLRNLEEGANKSFKSTKDGVEKLIDGFQLLQGRLLAIGALIATGLGFNRLVQDMTKLNSETGYLSAQLGVSAQELAKWEAAGSTVGAQANEIAASFGVINKSLADLQLGKGSFLSEFSRTTHMQGQGPAVELVDSQGRQRSSTDILLDISRWYKQQQNKAVATRLMEQIGFGQGMINMLALGPEELQKRLKEMEKFAPTDAQIGQFQKLQEAFGKLLTVVEAITRAISGPFIESLTKVLNKITDFLSRVYGGENPADVAGKEIGKVFPELKPNAEKPGIFHRGLDFLKRKWGGDSSTAAPGSSGGASGTGAASPSRSSATVGAGSSEFLRDQRQAFTDQLREPGVRQRVAGMAVLEGAQDPVPVIESLANRFKYVNDDRASRGLPPLTIDQMLNSGFYGPINRGQLPGAVAQLNRNESLAARMNSAIDAVSGGSNTIRGATDQGLPTDPNGMWMGGRVSRGGNIFNDWGGGPGGHAGSQAFRERQQAGVAAEQAARVARIPIHGGNAGNTDSAGVGSLPSFLPGATANVPSEPTPGSFQDRWSGISGLGGARGAVNRGGDSTTNNSSSSQTHINEMNVTVPPGADPQAYGRGIQQELRRFDNVQQSNTGLQ